LVLADVPSPSFVTLGQLANLQSDEPQDKLVRFLTDNSELFQGHGTDLTTFRTSYVGALNQRNNARTAPVRPRPISAT
jgi:hypothetical protein